MNEKTLIFIMSSLMFILTTYSTKANNLNDSLLLMIQDKDGIFIYNHFTQEEKRIYTFINNSERIDLSSYHLNNNNIHFKIFSITEKTNNIKNGTYYEKEYKFDILNNKLNLFKKIKNAILDSSLHIIEIIYSEDGKEVSTHEYKTIDLPQLAVGPFSDESKIVNNKKVISKDGNLYIENLNKKEELLLKHKMDFTEKSPKFLSGYINPDISHDGKKVIFRDMHHKNKWFLKKIFDDLINNFESYLIELNLLSQKQKTYKIKESVFNPRYSNSNNLILLKNGGASNIHYIFDLNTQKLKQIPNCNHAFWIY